MSFFFHMKKSLLHNLMKTSNYMLNDWLLLSHYYYFLCSNNQCNEQITSFGIFLKNLTLEEVKAFIKVFWSFKLARNYFLFCRLTLLNEIFLETMASFIRISSCLLWFTIHNYWINCSQWNYFKRFKIKYLTSLALI